MKTAFRTLYSICMVAIIASPICAAEPKHHLGYIDTTGKVVITPRYELSADFHDGMARAWKTTPQSSGSRIGYIDRTGAFVIKPQYETAQDFSEGLAAVQILDETGEDVGGYEYGWGYIDKSGKTAIEPQFFYVGDFHEGLAQARFYDALWGFVDKTGKLVIAPVYAAVGDFSEGLAPVVIGNLITGKWGYMNKSGKLVIQARYSCVESFSDGLAYVELTDKNGKSTYGFIDTTGKMVIKGWSPVEDGFSEGWALVWRDGGRVFIDKTGKVKLSADGVVFEGNFHCGLARASMGNKTGFINKRGKWAIQPQSKLVFSDFSEGLALYQEAE